MFCLGHVFLFRFPVSCHINCVHSSYILVSSEILSVYRSMYVAEYWHTTSGVFLEIYLPAEFSFSPPPTHLSVDGSSPGTGWYPCTTSTRLPSLNDHTVQHQPCCCFMNFVCSDSWCTNFGILQGIFRHRVYFNQPPSTQYSILSMPGVSGLSHCQNQVLKCLNSHNAL